MKGMAKYTTLCILSSINNNMLYQQKKSWSNYYTILTPQNQKKTIYIKKSVGWWKTDLDKNLKMANTWRAVCLWRWWYTIYNDTFCTHYAYLIGCISSRTLAHTCSQTRKYQNTVTAPWMHTNALVKAPSYVQGHSNRHKKAHECVGENNFKHSASRPHRTLDDVTDFSSKCVLNVGAWDTVVTWQTRPHTRPCVPGLPRSPSFYSLQRLKQRQRCQNPLRYLLLQLQVCRRRLLVCCQILIFSCKVGNRRPSRNCLLYCIDLPKKG